MTDKELLAMCDALKLEAEFHLGSASDARGLAKRVWTVATELKLRLTEQQELLDDCNECAAEALKRRLTEPNEREKNTRAELSESRATVTRCVDVLTKISNGWYLHPDIEGANTAYERSELRLLATQTLASIPDQLKRDAAVLKAAEKFVACNTKEDEIMAAAVWDAQAFSNAAKMSQVAYAELCQAAREGK